MIPKWLRRYLSFLTIIAFIGTLVVLFLIEPTPTMVETPLKPVVVEPVVQETD